MKKIILNIAAMLLLVSIFSCEKELITYQGQPDIYFYDAAKLTSSTAEPIADFSSISFTFATKPDSIRKIIVAVSGVPVNENREYNLSVNPQSTAISGIHYDALPKTFTIKKNQVRDTLLLKLHRTVDLQENTVSIILDLEPNNNFVTQMVDKVINTTTGEKRSFIKHSVFVNDIIKKPARWLDGYFGVFTRKKLFLMSEILGITPAYIDSGISVAELGAFGKVMQRYLNDRKSAGQPVLEDDGTEMIMGVSVQ